MSGPRVDAVKIREHVERLGERHPPIDLATADYNPIDGHAVRSRFGEVLEYMARVEMEVERNVLELAVLLPGVSETDRLFYAEVWGPQEAHHGILLDTLGQRLGLPPATPDLGQSPSTNSGVGSHRSPSHRSRGHPPSLLPGGRSD